MRFAPSPHRCYDPRRSRPVIALIPLIDRARGPLARWLTVYGRVPFFFYLLHLPLIHALALVVSKIRLGEVSPWLFTNHPMGNPLLLYLACRRYAELKARRTDWWFRYL